MATDKARWEFASPKASLRCGGLTAQVNVTHPHKGVQYLAMNSTGISGSLLAAEWISENRATEESKSAQPAGWPMQISDAYVRGGDLVATYGRFPNSHYVPQIYWRTEQAETITERSVSAPNTPCPLLPAPCSLSLIISVQTDLLESHPRIRVSTQLPADELIRVDANGAACLLWRLADGVTSYSEIATDSDYREPPRIDDCDGMRRAEWEVFAEFLEKGVIRRAQIHGVFLPRNNDVELANVFCQSVTSKPLPLTT